MIPYKDNDNTISSCKNTKKGRKTVLPWFKMPVDYWRSPAVQLLSLEKQGLLANYLCFMHWGEEYGHLSCGGQPLKAEELANLIPASKEVHLSAHAEFKQKGLLDRDGRGILFSPMLIDQRKQNEENKARVQKFYKKNGRETPSSEHEDLVLREYA